MPVLSFDVFRTTISSQGRILGLDYGRVRVGIAISDPERHVATPLAVITRRDRFAAFIDDLRAILIDRSPCGIVVGMPVSLTGGGHAGISAQAARAFVRNLSGYFPEHPVTTWDERLSTVAVEKARQGIASTSRQRRAAVDAHAAAWVLQGVLDYLAHTY